MKSLIITSMLLGVVYFLGWLGLHVSPKPFPAYAEKTVDPESIPLPRGLPEPVERFYRRLYGDEIPVIRTAVVSGRGWMRLFGLKVPIRFRFAHETGFNYRHDIDLTFLGMYLTSGHDTFIDGYGWAQTPGGVTEGPGFDQGSNISLWAEALIWFPSVLLTDERVEWKAVDQTTALLFVPFGEQRDTLVVRFNPEDGSIQYIEAMKYKAASGKKVLWINSTWMDEGKPWIRLEVEDVVYNTEVRDYIHALKH